MCSIVLQWGGHPMSNAGIYLYIQYEVIDMNNLVNDH